MLLASGISHLQIRVNPMTQQEQTQTQKSKAEDNFKFEIIYLLPVLASIIFGLGCAYLLVGPQAPPSVPATPISGSTPGAPIWNGLYFVILVAASATIFYFLLKRRSQKIIKTLITLAMTLAALLLSFYYLDALLAFIPSLSILLIPLTIVFTVLFDLAIFRFGGIPRNAAVVLIGGALGVFFANSIWMFGGLLSVVLIVTFLAVYDIFAVYRGPVGKIAESSSGLESLQGLSFAFKDIQMGLGDLVFYSMLTGAIFFNFINAFAFPIGLLPCIAAIIGIMAGSIITFFMLEKRGIFPGLPFPIMLGLAFGLITGFIILPLL